MKRFAVFASFVLLAVSLSAAETPVERYGQLAVDGNRLVSKKTGKPVQLRGMSFYWSFSADARDYYNADVVNWLADDWKVNLVRAAMGIEDGWNDGKGYLKGDNSGGVSNKKRVFDVVDAAIARGIYVIIDWHSHLAYERTDDAKTFFEEMANKYKDKHNVIYEIFNEPKQDPNGANATAFWANTVKQYSQKVVNAIRAIDPNNVIIIGTPTWSQDVDIASATPVDGANLVYALHFYSASQYHKASLRAKATKAMNTNGKAIFVSEFGVCNSDGNTPLDLDEATTWLDFLDANKVSWANWSICKLNEAASALKSTAPTTGVGHPNN
jgi:endoglucanase